jgi:hypothetical protein
VSSSAGGGINEEDNDNGKSRETAKSIILE